MYWQSWNLFGMHYIWWAFWFIAIVALFSFSMPVPRRTLRMYREDPLAILKNRYAAGAISTAEYEERRNKLLRDTSPSRHSTFPQRREETHA